jgi:hypothetical protein
VTKKQKDVNSFSFSQNLRKEKISKIQNFLTGTLLFKKKYFEDLQFISSYSIKRVNMKKVENCF